MNYLRFLIRGNTEIYINHRISESSMIHECVRDLGCLGFGVWESWGLRFGDISDSGLGINLHSI